MKVLFILPVLGQPRYSKRISMLQAEGIDAEVLFFERDYHRGRVPDCLCSSLGKVEHGGYLKRLFVYLKSIPKIRRHAKSAGAIYAFELDLAILSYITTLGMPIKRVVEIGDIREIQTSSGLVSIVLRNTEKFLMRKVDLLVVTAPKFYTEYYQKWLGLKVEHLIIENKLDKQLLPRVVSQVPSLCAKDVITIGYFGVLRCVWSATILLELAYTYPSRFSIVLAGKWILSGELFEKLLSLRNVTFLGEYQSPSELESIYTKVDLVWAVYEPFSEVKQNYNALWAKTNRFYESHYFEKPIVVLKLSGDEHFVKLNDTGLIIDVAIDVETLAGRISHQNINAWTTNIKKSDVRNFVYSDEAKTLIEAFN